MRHFINFLPVLSELVDVWADILFAVENGVAAWAAAAAGESVVAVQTAGVPDLAAALYCGVAHSKSLRICMMVLMSRFGRPKRSCKAGFKVPIIINKQLVSNIYCTKKYILFFYIV
jgi:hypothetical protein